MRAGKVVALVFGILMVLVALGLLIPGSILLGLYGTQRDEDGFFETSTRALSSNGHALVTPDVDLNLGGHWVPTGRWAAIRVKVTSHSESPAFVGIGPSDQVAAYLTDVEHDEVTNFGWAWTNVRYREVDGAREPEVPVDQDFWVASEEGTGTQVLEWDIAEGSWTAVVMNADGSAPVSAGVSLGARFDILLPIGIGMVVGGVIFLGAGILLIVLGARRSSKQPPIPAQMAPASTGTYPPVQPPTPDSQSTPGGEKPPAGTSS